MSTILITGGHSGIGLECSRQLASGSTEYIVFAGRSAERMEEVAGQLRQHHGVKVKTLLLDTSSLASVREAAVRFQSMLKSGDVGPLRAILCNAGGRAFGPVVYSADGVEETFAGNYLGHFLLIHLLLDSLEDDGRIIFTASGTHDPDTRDGKAVGPSVEPDARALANTGKGAEKLLSAGVRYATAKLCIIMFAYELHRRLRKAGTGIASIAFDPGSVPQTAFLRGAPAPLRVIARSSFAKWMMKRAGITLGSLDLSGQSLAKLAIDPAYANGSGKYFQVNDGSFNEVRSAAISYDGGLAVKLWDDSRKLLGLVPEEESCCLG